MVGKFKSWRGCCSQDSGELLGQSPGKPIGKDWDLFQDMALSKGNGMKHDVSA